MGRKSNPIVMRVGAITRVWDSKWFADRRGDFRKRLQSDLIIRKYFAEKLKQASISSVEISRDQQETVLTIHTSRPAVVIGRGGSGVEQIQKDLKKLTGAKERIRINVQEIRNPDTDAAALATQIVDQLERRMAYRRVLKQAVNNAMQAGAVGARVSVGGRLNGAEIARSEWLSQGNVPLHTLRADISYASRTAITTFGTIGVKVWINRGDLMDQQEEAADVQQEKKQTKKGPRRRRKSLADKVTKKK